MKLHRSWTHKTEHRFLSFQLVESSGPGFRAAVLPLLRTAFHETALAWRPASLPELGEDHIVWWSGEETPLLTACLAFPGPELGEEDVRTVQEAIRRFANSAVRTEHYLLVHNCESRRREAREAIATELRTLTSTARAARAESWDRQRLLGEAFNGMVRHTWRSLQTMNLSPAPLQALKDEAGFVPLEEVPCDLSLLRFNQHQLCEVVPQAKDLRDPATTILDPKGELLTLVTGEFGQGKTTSVARAVTRETRPVLYVPAARISKETVGKKHFLQQCIDQQQLFTGFPLEDHPTLEELSRPVVEYLLQDAESQALVVIDGLDESAFLVRRGGLQNLFNILQEIRSPIVLTMRTEFWERAVSSFADAFGIPAGHGETRNRKIRRIDLLPWGDDRIQVLIQRYRDAHSDPGPQSRLAELASLLEKGDLFRLYGDIPRRPLFLRLLLDTVMDEGLSTIGTGRARLLCNWANRKLYRDIQAPIAVGGLGRLPILFEGESDERSVEIAWEAMLQAAKAMIEAGEDGLELAADCTLDEIRRASPELARIEEPLGIFLNSLLLPAGPVPRGLPLRIRFAHRTFQEFFSAWFALIRPEDLPAGSLPDPVRDWMAQIQAEGLLPVSSIPVIKKAPLLRLERAAGAQAHSMQKKTTPPPDLEMRVRTLSENGRTRLSYTLHSSTGVAPFTHLEIDGPVLKANPEELHRSLLHQLGELGSRRDVGRELLLRDELDRKLIGIGRDLWRQLFTGEMRQAYRRFRSSVRSLLIISDEPWIPWEMVKPFDGEGEVLNDPFFGERFALTRWLAGERALPGDLRVRTLACVTGPGHLPSASKEKDFVLRLAQENEGLRDATPNEPGVDTLTALLEEGGLGLLHLALHGTFDPAMPNEAGLPLADGSVFRPSDLHGPVQTQVSQNRPLIVLNACSSGRQGWTWSGLGGWADRWVRVCGCGAFIGPLWQVRDSAALAFTQGLYNALTRGESLGKAAQEARLAARDANAGDPSWLAYTVYGHPNAQVVFGDEAPTIVPEPPVPLLQPRVPPAAPQKPVPAASTNLRIKKQFSDREKDQFIEETFESMASFFERSLGQLEQQNAGVETRFRRIDSDHFIAVIYVQGEKQSCRIWLDRGHIGDIAYFADDSGNDNTYNSVLRVEDDGYSIWLKPTLQIFSSGRDRLTAQEAAEYYWSMLVRPLQ